MAAAPAAEDAVARARRLPKLRVGLHVVLVEGRPALPPEQVPDLVDSSGAFREDMVGSAVDIFFRPKVRRQLLAEVEAQFAAFARTGLTLDHVNSHKHFHLHPTILAAILKVGRRYGMKAMRVPLEPAQVLAAVEPGRAPRSAWVTDPWAKLMRARLKAAGVSSPDHMFGLRWSGAMTADRIAGLIRNLPEGLSEIYLHPATAGGFAGSVASARYAEEFAALLDPAVIEAARQPDLALGGFADFA
jgi:hopanoid biosynthesis associated protein HpnK